MNLLPETSSERKQTNRVELPQFSYIQGIINIMGIISVNGQKLVYILSVQLRAQSVQGPYLLTKCLLCWLYS